MGFFQEELARLREVQMISQEKGKEKNKKNNHDQATPQTKLPANQPRADDGPGGGLCPLCRAFTVSFTAAGNGPQ